MVSSKILYPQYKIPDKLNVYMCYRVSRVAMGSMGYHVCEILIICKRSHIKLSADLSIASSFLHIHQSDRAISGWVIHDNLFYWIGRFTSGNIISIKILKIILLSLKLMSLRPHRVDCQILLTLMDNSPFLKLCGLNFFSRNHKSSYIKMI